MSWCVQEWVESAAWPVTPVVVWRAGGSVVAPYCRLSQNVVCLMSRLDFISLRTELLLTFRHLTRYTAVHSSATMFAISAK